MNQFKTLIFLDITLILVLFFFVAFFPMLIPFYKLPSNMTWYLERPWFMSSLPLSTPFYPLVISLLSAIYLNIQVFIKKCNLNTKISLFSWLMLLASVFILASYL